VSDRLLGEALVMLARGAIGSAFGMAAIGTRNHPALDQPGATFVTLLLDGELRGCVGSLEHRRALRVDVGANALAAAFRDPRFPPLGRREYGTITVEVSLLSPPETVAAVDEGDFLRQLRPGVEGIVLEYGDHRATFLPQVWEVLPEPRQFIAALKRKAGLPEDFWSRDMQLARYAVSKWSESEFAAERARS
jgi:AmmeMemoRadiSam system protein A